MKIHCVIPERAVLSRSFTEKLPKSQKVNSAFMHTFVLTRQNVSVDVRMHTQVQNQAQLQETKLWRVQVLEAKGLELDLLLTPAHMPEVANISCIALEPVILRNLVVVRFQKPIPVAAKKDPLLVRIRRALGGKYSAAAHL